MVASFNFDMLIVPIISIVIGVLFVKFPPKSMNYVIGYRTRRAMKNQETWEFANRYFGKLFLITAVLLLFLSLLAYSLMRQFELMDQVNNLILVQIIVLFVPIFITEKALKQRFDYAQDLESKEKQTK